MNASLQLNDQWQLRLPGKAAQSFEGGDPVALPAALREALLALPARTALAVQVAGARARWLLLPHSPRLVTEAAWATFAPAWFEQQHAQPASNWTLRWQVETPGQPRLLTALPNTLVQALRDATQHLALSLRVRTCERLAAWREKQPRFTGALCDMDSGHCVLILCHNGRPVRVRKRVGSLDAAALMAMLKTEWAMAVPEVPCTQWVWLSATEVSPTDAALMHAAGLTQITQLPQDKAAP
jgi:hypothetical protein